MVLKPVVHIIREPIELKFFFPDKVADDDIVRVSRHLLSSRPAIAAVGNLKNLPKLLDVESALASNDGKLSRKFRLFGG